MSLKPLDKTKHYGTVYGHPFIHFEQNGITYNAECKPVDAAGNVLALPQAKLEPKAQQPVPPPATDPDDDTPEDEKPIDLAAWARGELKGLMWHQVSAAVEGRYGRKPENKADALALIGTDAA